MELYIPHVEKVHETELISEILDILMPFDEATNKISGSEYITGNLVSLLWSSQKMHWKISTLNIVLPKVLSQRLLNSLKDRSAKILQNPLLCHASLSDP